MGDKPFIGIMGVIGCGKTTLAEALARGMGLPVFHEPVKDNIYLKDFYDDMGKYALAMQFYLLKCRVAQDQAIGWGGHGGVQDRTTAEDVLFAEVLCDDGHINRRDLQTYKATAALVTCLARTPDVLVYLRTSPQKCFERMTRRGRPEEVGKVSLEYLTALYEKYEEFVKDSPHEIIVVDWEPDGRDPEIVAAAIRNRIAARNKAPAI